MREMKDSGVEWIGKVPIEWEIIRLKTVILQSNAGEVIDKGFWNVGEELLYTCQRTPMNSNYSGFPDNKRTGGWDLLLTRNATPYIFIPENNSIYSNVVQRIRIHKAYNRNYIRFALQCGAESLTAYGDTIPSYNMQIWRNISIPNISFREQNRIATYLDDKCAKIDAIITREQSVIEKLKAYKLSVITEAVTKGLNPNVPMKDSGIEWIGEIPEGWDVGRLKDITKSSLQYGANASGIAYDEKLPRYIRITDITMDNKLKSDGKLSLPIEESKPFILKDKDLLFARSGGTVGKSFIYKEEYGLCAFAGYLIKATISEDVIPEFAYYYTLSSAYNEWKNRIFIQATIQNIGADKYSRMEIAIPNRREEQQGIVNYLDKKCDKIDSLIVQKEKLLVDLELYKKSLIYEVVTGKKEV